MNKRCAGHVNLSGLHATLRVADVWPIWSLSVADISVADTGCSRYGLLPLGIAVGVIYILHVSVFIRKF